MISNQEIELLEKARDSFRNENFEMFISLDEMVKKWKEIKKKTKHMIEITKEDLNRDRELGLSIKELAKKYKCSKASMSRLIAQFGLVGIGGGKFGAERGKENVI